MPVVCPSVLVIESIPETIPNLERGAVPIMALLFGD